MAHKFWGTFATHFLLATLITAISPKESNSMVTSNILQRTFQVRADSNSSGTGFTIEVDGRQYLITAKHVIKPDITSIEIKHDGQWKRLAAKVIAVEPEEVDIVVIALNQKISPTHPIKTGIAGTYVSQEVFFAGFPYGSMMMDGRFVNSSFPIPFVKRGTVSALSDGIPGTADYLDAMNNRGFSGGPVFTTKDPSNPTIIGVISGYRIDFQQLHSIDGPIPNITTHGNSGITIIYAIDYALRAIEKNPIGFKVSK
jgi:S1-C subfamily serine protease